MVKQRGPKSILFFEIVQMMGMRGYNIQPFNFLIEERMRNDKLISLGRESEVNEISDEDLEAFILNYRTTHYGMPPEMFQGEKIGISMVFERYGSADDCITTMVVVSNDKDGLTSKDTIVDFILGILKTLTQIKTKGASVNPFLQSNRVNGIFVLPSGVSSYSKTFLNELQTIQILTEGDILSRNYDQCLQSNIRIVDSNEKDLILDPVGLNGAKIPAVVKNNDAYCRVINPKKGNMMVIQRQAIAPEEALTWSTFLRDIR